MTAGAAIALLALGFLAGFAAGVGYVCWGLWHIYNEEEST